MSRPDRPIRILLYEDKQAYASSFNLAANKQRIIVDKVDNVDDLLEKLKQNPRKYQFIVLDARAYMHEGQAEGTEDEINLITILQELDKLKFESKIEIPHCINTGFADLKLRLAAKVKCPIFEKGYENDLFNHIWNEYANTDNAKLLLNYPRIFEFAISNFDDADYDVLCDLFKNDKFRSSDLATRINNLNSLRRTAEHLMDKINIGYLNNHFVTANSASRLGDILRYLNDGNDIPVHVFSTLTSIRKIAGNYGSHTPKTTAEIEDYPSEDLITGLALSLSDAFFWAGKKIQ